ncbi:MAG: DUF1848 domain-containing protein [bacterium]|nr:DUF1848 domain-containing protein [bacterium]
MNKIDLSHEWWDFTRRGECADPRYLPVFDRIFFSDQTVVYPEVLCIWTKAPAYFVELYGGRIEELKRAGVLVLAQVSYNGYSTVDVPDHPEVLKLGRTVVEPGIKPEWTDPESLVTLLGGGEYVRFRGDPVIPGFTCIHHIANLADIAVKLGSNRVTINLLQPYYRINGEKVGDRLIRLGVKVCLNQSYKQKKELVQKVVDALKAKGLGVAACAETAFLVRPVDAVSDWKYVKGLLPPACSDPSWAKLLKPELQGFLVTGSRKNCNCCYTRDLGNYGTECGRCGYCYARKRSNQ